MSVPAVMIAGTSSDTGKTTIAMGLIYALRKKALQVQPFKVGPDYIDPGHHSAAASRPSHNLDGWMLSREANIEIFHHATRGAELALIEGVMGLFDGLDGKDQSGSSAEMAQILGVPVVLVVDASAMGRSAAAAVWGFAVFDSGMPVAGVIFNKVGGPRHEKILREALASRCDIPCLGCLPRDIGIGMDDRHLGLVTAIETGDQHKLLEELAWKVASHLDLDGIMEIAKGSRIPAPPAEPFIFKGERPRQRLRLAVALDKAFNFYYRINLDLLEQAGAEIISFSPLEDGTLPRDTTGLYIGGGYPELCPAELSENVSMRECIAQGIASGMPVLAECGGFMYLCEGMIATDASEYPMVGSIPGRTIMTGSMQALGYLEATTLSDSPLGPAGSRFRGHEYRWSRAELWEEGAPAYEVKNSWRESGTAREGFAHRNLIAGYQHLHFASNPEAVWHFLENMKRYKEEQS
jgi:cobyrinic acid a,c-diamide synthase